MMRIIFRNKRKEHKANSSNLSKRLTLSILRLLSKRFKRQMIMIQMNQIFLSIRFHLDKNKLSKNHKAPNKESKERLSKRKELQFQNKSNNYQSKRSRLNKKERNLSLTQSVCTVHNSTRHLHSLDLIVCYFLRNHLKNTS